MKVETGNSNYIFHRGIVQKTEANSVLITITSQSACSGCHAENACSLSGKELKNIEIPGSYNVNKGDEVTVQVSQSSGFEAVLMAYVIPLVVLLVSLIVLNLLKMSELMAGLLSLVTLVPYYTILYLFRKRVNNRFNFTLND